MRRLRFSIAGLMGIVVVAAVGLAALRGATQGWFGAVYLLTRAILGLGILNAIFQRGCSRAWWVGFCLFGWGYLGLISPRGVGRDSFLPTTRLLIAARPFFGHPPDLDPGDTGPFDAGRAAIMRDYFYLRIGEDLWAMVAALLGGVLAWIAFARAGAGSGPPEDAPVPAAGRWSRARWIRPAIIVWAGLVLATSAAAVRSPWNAGFWAGMTFVLTFGLLGLAGLGALYAGGRRRRSWVGAGLLGGGYLVLVFAHSPYLPLPTGQLLEALRYWVPAIAGRTAAANARVRDALEQPVAMSFPNETSLGDLLRYVTRATATPDHPGIPIYLDPIGLQEAEKAPDSTVTIDLRGIPLKATLRACLRQLGMGYVVRDGFLWVTALDEIDEGQDPFHEADETAMLVYQGGDRISGPSSDLEDPYLIVGHCLIALLAAGFGAVAAPIVAEVGREPSDPSATAGRSGPTPSDPNGLSA